MPVARLPGYRHAAFILFTCMKGYFLQFNYINFLSLIIICF